MLAKDTSWAPGDAKKGPLLTVGLGERRRSGLSDQITGTRLRLQRAPRRAIAMPQRTMNAASA